MSEITLCKWQIPDIRMPEGIVYLAKAHHLVTVIRHNGTLVHTQHTQENIRTEAYY